MTEPRLRLKYKGGDFLLPWYRRLANFFLSAKTGNWASRLNETKDGKGPTACCGWFGVGLPHNYILIPLLEILFFSSYREHISVYAGGTRLLFRLATLWILYAQNTLGS